MSYRGYSNYGEETTPELGVIPSHWENLKIKFCLSIPITDGPHETPEILNEGIPFVSAEAVRDGQLDFSRKRGFISIEDHERFSRKYKPKVGDVYMVKSGATTGNVARVKTDEEFNIWSPLAALRPDTTKATTDFIYYFMLSKPFRHSVELSWSYGTQQNIGMGVVANLEMACPPPTEQKQIAAFLDWKTGQIDALITRKKELLEKLEEKRIAVITQAVTKGLNPVAPMRDSGVPWLGQVPQHWEVTPLGFLMTMSGGMTPSMANSEYWEGNIPWVTPKDMKQARITDSMDHVTETALMETSISLIPVNAVLIVVRGMILAHSFPTAITERPVTINQDMKALRCGAQLEPEYLFWCLTGFEKVFSGLAQESAHGTRKLETETLKKFRFPVPPLAEQTAITGALEVRLRQLDQLAELTENTITCLSEYRTALITAATTGKIDVRKVKLGQ